MAKTKEQLEAEIEELRKTNAELADQLQRKAALKESLLNQPRIAPNLDAEGYGRRLYAYRKEPGVKMRMKTVPDDPRGFTYHLKNAERFWEGTETQFREAFDKTDEEAADEQPAAN